MKRTRTAGWWAWAAVAFAGCGGARSASAPRPLLVFAASSLAAPFAAIELAFEAANPGVDVQCSFAGTPQLVLQLREGAAADVFASADTTNMA
ncbi:MAG: substrate-binding domain-containing protein, partial [Planctomycetota bacterium]